MTTEQKIIRAKVGLLELAKQLGNVSQARPLRGTTFTQMRKMQRSALGSTRSARAMTMNEQGAGANRFEGQAC